MYTSERINDIINDIISDNISSSVRVFLPNEAAAGTRSLLSETVKSLARALLHQANRIIALAHALARGTGTFYGDDRA